MADIKGTRMYWRPSGSDAATAPKQILKNTGYISVVLQAVQYKSNGNWWQQTFRGSDKITVSTQVTWQSGSGTQVAAAIQDYRKVSVPSVNALAIGRNVVLKAPAIADGVEMQVTISAVQDDNLGRTLQILNSDEFKQPLQLAPAAMGQVLAIANLVKKVFSETDPSLALNACYPAILSEGAIPDPVVNSRLVEGYIIVVVKQDAEDQIDFDEGQLTVGGSGLLYNGKPIPNTYMVYNISCDPWRGRDTGSAWSQKFDQASSLCDELMFAAPEQRQSTISTASDLLKEGGALLDADPSYIALEKVRLKQAAYQEVKDKITANTGGLPGLAKLSVHVSSPFSGIETGPNLREEVMAYAHDLARSGQTFGFSVRAKAD